MIALSRDEKILNNLVINLTRRNYRLTDEGSLYKYQDVNVMCKAKGYIELIQPFLIQRIIDLLGLESESTYNTKLIQVMKLLLHKDLKGEHKKNIWVYRQAVGMLTYLQATTRPDIAMVVHQCARFSNKPMLTYKRAVKARIGRYFVGYKKEENPLQTGIQKRYGVLC